MQNKASFIVLFLFFSISVFGQDNWLIYKSPENDFKVKLPKDPALRSKELNTELGMLATQNFSVAMDKKDKNFFYSINVVRYPSATFSKDSTEFINETLTSSIDALSTNLKCKLVYKNETTVSGHKAFLFRLTDDFSGQVVKGIEVLKDDKLYTLTVFTMLDRSLNADIDKFLLSFELIN